MFPMMRLDAGFLHSLGCHLSATLLAVQPPEFADEVRPGNGGIAVVGIENPAEGDPTA